MFNDFIFGIAVGVTASIITYLLARIKGIKWKSSQDSGRNRIKFLKTVKIGARKIYPSPQHWNYSSIFENHHIASFIGVMIEPDQYQSIKEQLGVLPRITWFKNVDSFMKHRSKLLELNDRLNEVLKEKVMFKIIRAEHHDIVEPIKPLINVKSIEKFTIEANKALKYYSRIIKTKV